MPGKGVHKRRENLRLEAEWRVAMRPGNRRKLECGSEEALAAKAKASVRTKVEYPFLRLKWLFGYGKVRYRGLAKNMERLALLFGLGNLLTAEGTASGVVRPAAGPSRPNGPRRAPVALSGAKLGDTCRPATPGLRLSQPSVLGIYNPGQTSLVQNFLRATPRYSVRVSLSSIRQASPH